MTSLLKVCEQSLFCVYWFYFAFSVTVNSKIPPLMLLAMAALMDRMQNLPLDLIVIGLRLPKIEFKTMFL